MVPKRAFDKGDTHDRSHRGFSAKWRWLLVGCIVTAAGCSEARVPVFPVSGKVSFQGKPPAGAIVVLNPVNTSENHNVMPTGTVKDDGSFTLTAYEPDDGAPQGEYVATIQWYKVTKEAGGPGPNVLPKTYGVAKSSPIKVNVANGPVEIPPIAIR
jgi:hypothetical protein